MSEHASARPIVSEAPSRPRYAPARARARGWGVGERPWRLMALAFLPAVLFEAAQDLDWLAGLAIAALGLALLARSRRRRRSGRDRLEVSGGSWRWRRAARRELERILREWPAIAEAAGIAESRLMTATVDVLDGYRFDLEAPGFLGVDIDLPRLQSALMLPVSFIVTVPDPMALWRISVVQVREVEAAA